jgi:hypothetical protein
MDKRTTNMLLVGGAVLALILLGGGVWLVVAGLSGGAEPAAALPTATAVAQLPPATDAAETLTPTPPTVPTTAVVLLPSATPPPTVTPTNTPEVTNTPVATETPTPPPATNTAVPVVIPPTQTPTATAVPPTATPAGPQPGTVNGISATHFALRNDAQLWVGGDIWFEFRVANASGGNVPYGALGVMPRRNGADLPQWFQRSWGGNNDSLPTGGLTWDDRIRIPESGSYTLRLMICFESGAACMSGGGTFHTLSQEIPVNLP